jgi:hypothetical protein
MWWFNLLTRTGTHWMPELLNLWEFPATFMVP